jgi:serine/threonine-protein kinase
LSQEYLGSYRLLNLVRTGKTCQLWEAVKDGMPERYALKLLTSAHRHDKGEVELLRREYEAAGKMSHPHVIRIFELKVERDIAYLVMEYFPAPNVKQLIQQGVDKIAPRLDSFIRHAAEALGHVHAKGWVHRDIKPDNFLMRPDGEVKLIDFALAQRIRRGLGRLFAGRSKVQGTRSYMSPEQIRGQVLDERADLYSFGCVLHEVISGKPPFTGANTNELLNKHLRSPPPPIQAANNNISDAFSQLLRRLLAKTPDGRPATAADFLREYRAMGLFKQPPAAARS